MFDVSTKLDYGLLVMVALAEHWPNQYSSLQTIAEHNHISGKYLSQVIIPLHRAGLVKSKEGKNGGYALTQAPASISVRNIVEAIDGPLQLVRCMKDDHCPAERQCGTKSVWKKLKYDIYQLLEAKTLADIITL